MKNILLLVLTIFMFSACQEKTEVAKSTFENFKEKRGKEVMVLEIGASSCKSCKDMKVKIDELKSSNPNLPIHIIDVYDDMKAFSYFNIKLIPTQIAYDKNGKEIYRHIGGLSKSELLDVVELANGRN